MAHKNELHYFISLKIVLLCYFAMINQKNCVELNELTKMKFLISFTARPITFIKIKINDEKIRIKGGSKKFKPNSNKLNLKNFQLHLY